MGERGKMMSNYSDYRCGMRACIDYAKVNDLSDVLSKFNRDSNWFTVRSALNEKHPIDDYWKDSAWNWLGPDEIAMLIIDGNLNKLE